MYSVSQILNLFLTQVLEFIDVCVCRHWKLSCEIQTQHNIVPGGSMKFDTFIETKLTSLK